MAELTSIDEFALYVCSGKCYMYTRKQEPLENTTSVMKMYSKKGVDKADFTICAWCVSRCVPANTHDDKCEDTYELIEDTLKSVYTCDCKENHVRLENGDMEFGTYDCAKCKPSEREAGSVLYGNIVPCAACSDMNACDKYKYCRWCCLKMGICRCGNNLSHVDHSYLRTYFCKGLGLPLDGRMSSVDLMLNNVAKSRIASTFGGYRHNPDILAATNIVRGKEFSYFMRANNTFMRGYQELEASSEEDTLESDDNIFQGAGDNDYEYNIHDEEHYHESVMNELEKSYD